MTNQIATAGQGSYFRVRWQDSIILRVILLCVVLLLCMLGSVYVITRHYFQEMTREMETRTEDIASKVVLWLEENPDATPEEVGTALDASMGVPIELQAAPVASEPTRFSPKIAQGVYVVGVTHTFMWGQQPLRLTAQFTLTPQTEIARAFKNKYMAALALVVLAALILMVYFIVRLLRPLSELTETCTHIMQGQLEHVRLRRNSGEVLALERTFNAMIENLREKELVEANLRQAQRLSAIGNLAAGVAHDIRNPLNAIKLISGHALDTLAESSDNSAAVRQLNTIRAEVDRLENIVSSFLSLAKERELQPEPTRIDAVLEGCLRLIRQDAEARQVELASELRAGDTALTVDPKQVTRAVLNVLLNALDACPKSGRVRMFSRVTDTTCEIEVRDDGAGMSRQVAERAFDPYFTTKPTGTGLGLSITRGIIEEHGGKIQLTSETGRGCQVLITLPLNTGAP